MRHTNTALMKLGGSRGVDEVRSRGATGPIEIELKFRDGPGQDLEKQRVRKPRGWRSPRSIFPVMRDQDADDCVTIKREDFHREERHEVHEEE